MTSRSSSNTKIILLTVGNIQFQERSSFKLFTNRLTHLLFSSVMGFHGSVDDAIESRSSELAYKILMTYGVKSGSRLDFILMSQRIRMVPTSCICCFCQQHPKSYLFHHAFTIRTNNSSERCSRRCRKCRWTRRSSPYPVT